MLCSPHVNKPSALALACGRSSESLHINLNPVCRHSFKSVQLVRSTSFPSARTLRSRRCISACLQTAAAPVSSKSAKSCAFDVIALGNLCLDIFVSVPELPSTEIQSRRKLLADLTAAPPSRTSWEVGGNTNFLIAAARLGMQVAPVGHLGPDEYGKYIQDVLQVLFCCVT